MCANMWGLCCFFSDKCYEIGVQWRRSTAVWTADNSFRDVCNVSRKLYFFQRIRCLGTLLLYYSILYSITLFFRINRTAPHTVLPSLPALPERNGSMSSHLIFHVFIKSWFSNCCLLKNAKHAAPKKSLLCKSSQNYSVGQNVSDTTNPLQDLTGGMGAMAPGLLLL